MAKKDVVIQEEGGLPVGIDFAADAGAGSENMGQDDVATPFLGILQKMSPQADEDDDAYIDGAKAGMFYNNVTGQVIDVSEVAMLVVPVHYEREYVEWVPRSSGGGMAGRHAIGSDIMSQTTLIEDPNGKLVPTLVNGNIIIETAYHYCLTFDPDKAQWTSLIITMKSSALKKSKRLNNIIMTTQVKDANGFMVQAPRWSSIFNFKTIRETKDTNSWYNFDIERVGWVDQVELYNQAKKFYTLIQQGNVQKNETPDTGSSVNDDEIPL